MTKTIQHIHLIAICGTGMGSLAMLLKEKGFTVTGSDQNVYPPMSTTLENAGIKIFTGFKAENLNPKPDLVIVGNAISKTNPEAMEMEKLGLKFMSFPQAMGEFFIKDKKSIVISGTHGKTTTTALMAHLLKELKADPGYLIGGVLHDGQKNVHDGKGDYFVIEGDEYDTAYFDKGPKFLHYRPYYTLITSLEFDHADIYRDLDHLTESFVKLIDKTNPNGFLLLNTHYPKLIELRGRGRASPLPEMSTYGINGKGDWDARDIEFHPVLPGDAKAIPTTSFKIFYKEKLETTLTIPMVGSHNVQNALACFVLLKKLGYQNDAIQKVFSTFKGVKRRQEVREKIGDILVMDDFAHHPTAVLETIAAVKKAYPQHKLWAIFEPRSNSSKRNVFQEGYGKAFDEADQSIIANVFMPEKVPDGKILDVPQIVAEVCARGKNAINLPDVDAIIAHVVSHITSPAVLLIMSNGAFGGIHQKMADRLSLIAK
ncbi:UDP-N-acetylmuramate--L-alanine ligase [bacterium]|nr:UDP-N-acetylmuramate--L-alanine ligase [bacterium]